MRCLQVKAHKHSSHVAARMQKRHRAVIVSWPDPVQVEPSCLHRTFLAEQCGDVHEIGGARMLRDVRNESLFVLKDALNSMEYLHLDLLIVGWDENWYKYLLLPAWA